MVGILHLLVKVCCTRMNVYECVCPFVCVNRRNLRHSMASFIVHLWSYQNGFALKYKHQQGWQKRNRLFYLFGFKWEQFFKLFVPAHLSNLDNTFRFVQNCRFSNRFVHIRTVLCQLCTWYIAIILLRLHCNTVPKIIVIIICWMVILELYTSFNTLRETDKCWISNG